MVTLLCNAAQKPPVTGLHHPIKVGQADGQMLAIISPRSDVERQETTDNKNSDDPTDSF